MTNKEKRRFAVARIGELKDATIVLDLETMDTDNDLALYDSIFHCFARGDLDNQFESVVFDGMSEDDRVKLISLVGDYRGLCFYNGKAEYWLDSLEGVPITDSELITYSIFDNYDYLLELGKKGGKRVLEQLDRFSDSGYINSSVVEYLRRSNVNDEVLESILLDMAREDSLYNIFSDEQKVLLLGNAFGNLYTYTQNGVEITSPIKLACGLYNKVLGKTVEITDENKEEVVKLLYEFLLTNDVDSVIVGTCDDYVLSSYEKGYPTNIEEITVDESFDYLRNITKEYSISYDEDDFKRM